MLCSKTRNFVCVAVCWLTVVQTPPPLGHGSHVRLPVNAQAGSPLFVVIEQHDQKPLVSLKMYTMKTRSVSRLCVYIFKWSLLDLVLQLQWHDVLIFLNHVWIDNSYSVSLFRCSFLYFYWFFEVTQRVWKLMITFIVTVTGIVVHVCTQCIVPWHCCTSVQNC